MSLRTKINGFTAWVNLRLTPYNQLLNDVLMDLLTGTNMKYFVESFTGRDMKKLENMDGMSQQQKQTRVDWVMDELKKCDVIPDDVFIDARLFAMRSADHVFDLMWRLISHDVWFVWERVEYLQTQDFDVLTQVPFKWTPDPPPPKKKKPKRKTKQSLLAGFGASSIETIETPGDHAHGSEASSEHGDHKVLGRSSRNTCDSDMDIINKLEAHNAHTYDMTQDGMTLDLGQQPDSARSFELKPDSAVTGGYHRNYSTPRFSRNSYFNSENYEEDSRLSASIDIPVFESRNSETVFDRSSCSHRQSRNSDHSTIDMGRSTESYSNEPYKPPKVKVYTMPLKPGGDSAEYLIRRSSFGSVASMLSETTDIRYAKPGNKSSNGQEILNSKLPASHKKHFQAGDGKKLLLSGSQKSKTWLRIPVGQKFRKKSAGRNLLRKDAWTHKEAVKVGEVAKEINMKKGKQAVKSDTEEDVAADYSQFGNTSSSAMLETYAGQFLNTLGGCESEIYQFCGLRQETQDEIEETWVKFPHTEYMKGFKKKKRDKFDYPSPEECILEMIGYQLKTTQEGRSLTCHTIDDLVDSRVLCALVNSFVPNTFTVDLLLNDRWTINMALKTGEKMFYAETPFDSEDLVEADNQAVCAYFASFLMVAYRYRQTMAVINRVDFIKMLIRECNHNLEKIGPKVATLQQIQDRTDLKVKLQEHRQALQNLERRFDVDFSKKWVQHVEHVQNEMRREIREKMRQRFDIVEIPRNITINDFCLAAVINLSLTSGSGFYKTTNKEMLGEGRKLVLRHKETGVFIEDFTNKSKVTIRETLGLPELTSQIVEINPAKYPQFDFFFEAPSRNKQLKPGTQFMYQVFPGNTSTWQRLFVRCAKEGNIETVHKMIMFFKHHPSFINCREPKTANTALHWAARMGHFEIVRLLLENGAHIDLKNAFKCTALNMAVEGLQRKIAHYLIEWGCDVLSRNIKNLSTLETIRNDDFKRYAINFYNRYSHIVPRIMAGDMALLDKVIEEHVTGAQQFCCLRSRCINGSTLLHTASYYGHKSAIEELLAQHVDINLRDYKGATPLHRAKNPDIMELLLEAGAQVNAEDSESNTPLHVKCYGETNIDSELESIELLLNKNACPTLRNSRGLMPIHCCAMQGRVDVMQLMLRLDQNNVIDAALSKEDDKKPPSLLHLALANDFIGSATWLLENNFQFKPNEQDLLLRRILTEQIKLNKREEAVKFLLDNGANPNSQYPGENTGLHYAAGLSGPTDVLELLLNYGADVEAVNEDGCTPLFSATQCNNKFAACVFIEQGSNMRHRNTQGFTAFDYIVDFEEWIECGYFNDDVKARLKAYNLKHSRDLIRAISKKVKPGALAMRSDLTRSAFSGHAGHSRPEFPMRAVTASTSGMSLVNTKHRMLPAIKTVDRTSGYITF